MSYLFIFAWSVFFVVMALGSLIDLVVGRGKDKPLFISEIIVCALCACMATYLICRMFAM